MPMTLDEIKELIEFIRGHELSEFELEQGGVKIRIKTGRSEPVVLQQAPVALPIAALPVPAAAATTAGVSTGPTEEGAELAILKSPIVGTFYRAAEPDAKPLAAVGDIVRKGQVLCIIEAMKLMNEIDSEYDGEVVSVYVENGEAVQYGERLFAIRPTA